jgi:enoyl-CoA hydratase/carnithine racemase
MEMALCGERIGAAHALRIGLVNAIIPQRDLVAKCLQYATMLASRVPLAERFAKDVMKRAIGLPLDEALCLGSRSFHDLGQTADRADGTAAFREKRPPQFAGR